MPRHLQETLQALYDSEINVTITTLWDAGYDFALCSYMDDAYDDMHNAAWHHVPTAAELAEALHKTAMEEFPESSYARSQIRTA